MKRSRKRVIVVWLASLAAIIAADQIERILTNFHLRFPPLGFISFVAWVTLCALTLYLLTVGIRYILRNLFWRVGRRLALSYFLLGFLPFLFFAVLVVVSGYLMAAVLSQASFRNERQNTLEKLDQWNLEYALTNIRPASALPTQSLRLHFVHNLVGLSRRYVPRAPGAAAHIDDPDIVRLRRNVLSGVASVHPRRRRRHNRAQCA